MQAYIEIVGGVLLSRQPLSLYDLRDIGEFTRENIAAWLDRRPVEDSHAVCGGTEIPWATEEAKQRFERVHRDGRWIMKWYGWEFVKGERDNPGEM